MYANVVMGGEGGGLADAQKNKHNVRCNAVLKINLYWKMNVSFYSRHYKMYYELLCIQVEEP